MKIYDVKCPYCGQPTSLVTGQKIYNTPRFKYKYFYLCEPCNAYVGTHKHRPYKPYGMPANKELREKRMEAHGVFDKLWKSGKVKRFDAYTYLSNFMQISRKDCHIGQFSVEQCDKIINGFNDWFDNL